MSAFVWHAFSAHMFLGGSVRDGIRQKTGHDALIVSLHQLIVLGGCPLVHSALPLWNDLPLPS